MLGKYISKYNALPIQIKASLWFFICSFFQKGIATLTTPIFTRILTAEEYGQFNVFYSWLGIVSVFVSLNLCHGGYTPGLIKFSNNRPTYSSSMQGLSLFLMLIWTAVYIVSKDFWNQIFGLTTVQMLSMLAIIWLSVVYGFWSSEQRVEFKYRKLVQLTLLGSILTPLLGVYMVINAEDKVTARILSIVIVNTVLYIGLFLISLHRGRVVYSKKYWRYALAFNVPLIIHYLSGTLLISSDRIMIQKLINDSAAGIYSLGYSISQVMIIINTALQQTIEPWRYKKIHDGRAKDIASIAYPTLILVAGVNLLLIIFAPELVAFFAPITYYDAIWIIPPVSMSVYFMFICDYFSTFEFYYAKSHYIVLSTSLGAIINILLNYFLLGKLGYYVAGYTTLLCYIIYAVLHYYFMLKICRQYLKGISIYDKNKLIKISFIFTVGGFFALLTYPFPYIRYGLIVMILLFIIAKRKWLNQIMIDLINVRRSKKISS